VSGVKWALIAKIDSSEAFAPVKRLERDLMIVGGLALLVVIVTGAWLSRSLLGPLRELTAGVRRFAAGDHDVHVPVRTRDEIGQLCLAFNGMVDEINEKNLVIESKNRENEELLLNVLPAPIANRLRGGEQGPNYSAHDVARAAELCAIFGFAAVRNNDRVGLLIFTDQVELFIPPRKGRRHVLRLIREVLAFQPRRRGTDIPVHGARKIQHGRRLRLLAIQKNQQQGEEQNSHGTIYRIATPS
jgi:HAMP domain-containing protein